MISLYAGGKGTSSDPYLIKNAEHLNNVRKNLDAHFKQIDDLDLSDYATGTGWSPISDEMKYFTGYYDGNHFEIKNLYVHLPDTSYVGLFSYIGKGAVIEKIKLERAEVKGRKAVGCLVGTNYFEGRIKKCSVRGKAEGKEGVGGLIGVNEGSVKYSSAEVEVSGDEGVGGLVGRNWYFGDSLNNYYLYEGMVGEALEGNIFDCYACGKVSGKKRVGGLAGFNAGNIERCYSVSEVKGEKYLIGNLVGGDYEGEIKDSYYEGESDQGAFEKGILFNRAKDSQKDIFNNWDFEKIWEMREDNLPAFHWKQKNT